MQKVSRDLNLIIPVERDNGAVLRVHVKPISRDVFESLHRVFSIAFKELTAGGIEVISGLSTAALVLRDNAKDMGVFDGPNGVNLAVFQDLRRSAMVAVVNDQGRSTYSLHDAERMGILDAEEVREVENAAVFFTLVLHLFGRKHLSMMVNAICTMGGLQTTSLNATAWLDSLPTSIDAETSASAKD